MIRCKVIITNKDIEFQCNILLESGNGQALLDMQYCERLQLLSINLQGRQINEQIRQEISPRQTEIQKLIPLHHNKKINQEIDYFTVGPDKESNKVQAQKEHRNCTMNRLMY